MVADGAMSVGDSATGGRRGYFVHLPLGNVKDVKSLFRAVGGDGGTWCLSVHWPRSIAAGFLTISTPAGGSGVSSFA